MNRVDVEVWLAERRSREPSINASVALWLGLQHFVKRPRHKSISTYLPAVLLREIQEDAKRHDRTVSESVCKAWELARDHITQFPAACPMPQPEGFS